MSTPNAGLQDRSDTVDPSESLTPVGKTDILADFGGDTAAPCVINVHFGVKIAEALYNLTKQLFLREVGSVFSADIATSCANEFVLDFQQFIIFLKKQKQSISDLVAIYLIFQETFCGWIGLEYYPR